MKPKPSKLVDAATHLSKLAVSAKDNVPRDSLMFRVVLQPAALHTLTLRTIRQKS